MVYPNPLGYWVSARRDHPDHQTLADIESKFGSYFENLATDELQKLLLYCAGGAESAENAITTVAQLSEGSRFGLIPFLYEVINSRRGK